jgi:hypothetical protein
LAFGGAHFFRVVQAGAGKTRGQDDSRRCDGAGQRASAGFIDTGDPLEAADVKGCLEGKVGHGIRSG